MPATVLAVANNGVYSWLIVVLFYFRLFRKYVFGEADEIELKFVNR
jgi:hypothetical protein